MNETTTNPTAQVGDRLIMLPGVTTSVTIAGEWFRERDELLAEVQSRLQAGIANDRDYRDAADLMKDCHGNLKAVEEMRKKLGQPFASAKKAIDDAAKAAVGPLEEAKATLQQQLSAYSAKKAEEERQARAAAERRAQEEAERAAAEAQALADLEGEEAAPVIVETAPVAVAPPAPTGRVAGANVRTREVLSFAIAEPEAVPYHLCSPDPAKIRAYQAARLAELTAAAAATAGRTFTRDGITWTLETKVTA